MRLERSVIALDCEFSFTLNGSFRIHIDCENAVYFRKNIKRISWSARRMCINLKMYRNFVVFIKLTRSKLRVLHAPFWRQIPCENAIESVFTMYRKVKMMEYTE